MTDQYIENLLTEAEDEKEAIKGYCIEINFNQDKKSDCERDLRDTELKLRLAGYVPCASIECNCGSYHPRSND